VGTLTLTGTTHTDAGDYPADAWTFSGGTNYNDASGTVHDSIAKINATITVTPYSVNYDGTAHTATGTATGLGGANVGTLTLTGTTHTNAGDYPTDAWTFSGGTNYNDASGTVHDSIAKINATITVTPYSVNYDGNSHTATGTATGVGGANVGTLTLTGTTHTNAGAYNGDVWSFAGGTNYNDASGTVNDSIAKINATITVTPYNVTYDGTPHTATGTATGVGATNVGTLTLTGTTHTNAGAYNGDAWSFAGGTNYNDASGAVNDLINKANQTITWSNPAPLILSTALTGTQLNATVSVVGPSTAGALSYTPAAGTILNIGVGQTLSVTAAGTANYNSATKTVTINVQYASAGSACYGDYGHTILQPVDGDGSSVFKQKSTVPAKFRVCGANGVSIGTPGVIESFRLIQTIAGTVVDVVDEAVDSTTPDPNFRWDPSAQQWIFNMNTKSLSASRTYVYRIGLNDGTNIDFRFGLK
jgi:hypothetical protein